MSDAPPVQKSLKGTILAFLSADFFVFGLAFATSVLAARVLGPAGRGAGSLLILVATILTAMLSLGVHEACVYFSNAKHLRSESLLANATLLILAMSAAVAGVMWSMSGQIIAKLGVEQYQAAYYWSSALFAGMMANLLYVNMLLGRKQFADRNVSALLLAIVQFALAAALMWAWGLGVTGWLAATTAAYLLSSLYALARLSGGKWRHFAKPDRVLFAHSLGYGLKVQLGTLMQMLNYRLDVFFVNYFLGLSGVGIYSVAVSVVEAPSMMPQVIGKVLFAVSSNNQETYGDKYSASLCRKSTALMICVGAGMLATAWFFVPLIFGDAFDASVLPLLILIPGSICIGIYKVLVFGLMGKGFPLIATYAAGPALAVTIALDLLLIPLWGVPGAAAASTASYLTCAAAAVYWYARKSGLPWHEFVLPKIEDWRFLFEYVLGTALKLLRLKPAVSR